MKNNIEKSIFYSFLVSNFEKGAFTNDDAVAIILPLLKTVASIHNNGKISMLNDLANIIVEDNKLNISHTEHSIRNNTKKLETLFANKSEAFKVSEEYSHKVEIGDEIINKYKDDSLIIEDDKAINKPAYLKNYVCYETYFEHHDPLTDIFILGIILASIALNLDFTDEDDLTEFVRNRKSMVFINAKIHPAIANIIVGMTDLNRNSRWKDLNEIIEKLKNYREYNPENEYDLSKIVGDKKMSRNRFIHEKLRNRLFDNSRRNRLMYYKPNLKFLNLTVSSVPQVLNYNNIDANSIFYWNNEISKKITNNSSISLNKYLRFEDNAYISPTLDKIRLESNKDINEYGFSQLKLVLCFLNWYNTKENTTEKIQSPLLLTPISLSKQKGLKDQFTIDFLDAEVEINPVLANTLKELYDIKLPETIQLSETSIEDVFELLKQQVEKNSSGIVLEKIDKPRIKLIHTQAQSTLSQYNKRVNKRKAVADVRNIEYSYSQDDFHPYGLELFKQYINTGASSLEFLIDSNIPLHTNSFNENKTVERVFYTIDEGDTNPFRWEFDTCNIVMGNFNYKKMSLVRDYNLIIENEIENPVFKSLFSDLAQREFSNKTESVNTFTKTYNVVASDPTQNKAVLLSELGENYIIQGPPGTGKSQTIANLVSNFIANGKKVLFVCEKRAALDVVYYRLKNQGLDELCCLIHDSQTDKKEFILNLKESYNNFSSAKDLFETVSDQRNTLIQKIETEINVLNEFHQFMKSNIKETDISIKEIFDILIFNKEEISKEDLDNLDIDASYSDWESNKNALQKIFEINVESNKNKFLNVHPFRSLKRDFYSKNENLNNVVSDLENSNEVISELAEEIDLVKLTINANSKFNEIKTYLNAAIKAIALFDNNTEHLLINKTNALSNLAKEISEIEKLSKEIKKLETIYPFWKQKLSNIDTINALAIIEKSEGSFFNFLNSSFQKTKKQILQGYNINEHQIKPKLSAILTNLVQQNKLLEDEKVLIKSIEDAYKLGEINSIKNNLEELYANINDDVVKDLSSNKKSFVEIKKLQKLVNKIDNSISLYLENCSDLTLVELEKVIDKIIDKKQYFQLYANHYAGLGNLNNSIFRLIQQKPITLIKLQKLLAETTLQKYYANHFSHTKYNMDLLHHTTTKISMLYEKLLALNGKYITEKQKNSFKELIKKSEMSVAGMNEETKDFKKSITEGRKILENEFGKTIRYKSIRDLSTQESGKIIRELKPVWLMSPLSVSDTLPLSMNYFDVVIFDEASQITLEEGLPPIYRSTQSIIVGDEMQMPPSNFFGSASNNKDDLWQEDENENENFSLDADSFLTQGARKFPSIMLGWHYRSKHEALIGFSNASFYQNQLLTIPDVKDHQTEGEDIVVTDVNEAENNVQFIYEKPISYHYLSKAVYENRTNEKEAQYIAQLIKKILSENNHSSIGVVAFSMEQQNEIENAIQDLCVDDKVFENLIEEEYKRIEDNQFVGLFIKNLENVQGDERDIIIMSTCYGYDPRGKMLMNFGPINKRGGEKRLNVIFSRAKKSMCVVSSIKYTDIKNEYNDGANYFRKYLQYAELISKGKIEAANNVLNTIQDNYKVEASTTVLDIKNEIEKLGYDVQLNIGQSSFKCSIGIKKSKEDTDYILGIIVDDTMHYAKDDIIEQYLLKPQLLKYSGWNICQVYVKDWLDNKERVLKMIKSNLNNEPFFESEIEEEIILDVNMIEEKEIEEHQNEVKEEIIIESGDLQFVRLTNTENGSNKFWEIATSEKNMVIQYGRIGTKGQKLIKSFDTNEKAKAEMAGLIAQKKARGYK